MKFYELKSKENIESILVKFDNCFSPPISLKVKEIQKYAYKLLQNAVVWVAEEDEILGFVSMYANDTDSKIAYIPFIAVLQKARNKYVGSQLLSKCKEIALKHGMEKIKLEVRKSNQSAQSFYRKNGFKNENEASVDSIYMICDLDSAN